MLPSDIVNSILHAYDDSQHRSSGNTKQNATISVHTEHVDGDIVNSN
jgi:hypothetical protein